MTALAPWVADALVVAGLGIVTVAVWGLARMNGVYARLHAAGKAVVLGLVPLLLAAATTGDAALVARAALVLAFLVLTAPVAAHAIARATHVRRRRAGAAAGEEDRP